METNSWNILFDYAMQQVKNSALPSNTWEFGGGTVLMQKYNHRISKDIDIFFSDPQCLTCLSPRVNDALEDKIINYIEQYNYIKLYLDHGEIDFILAKQVSNLPPKKENIRGICINVEHPVEIIAKKIEYRSDEFKTRDVFDLAMVYSKLKLTLLKNVNIDAKKYEILNRRITELHKSGTLDSELINIRTLPGAEHIRGKEYSLCSSFLSEMEKFIDRNHQKQKGLGH